ncbi:MAG TPA: ribonuclease H-like domain-containing protein [Thermoanaerobaculia bacterium]|nr:ribonuclease H-like domain-containing protein [Thermoanaerobaculia bacterium]
MKRLVVDIETVGTPWEEHDPYVREYLIKGMNEAEAEEEKRRGALSPFTGHIITIGVMNVDSGQMAAYLEVPGQDELLTEKDGNRTYLSGNEKLILEAFWNHLREEDRFITFNGRQFDGPFLMIRSAILGLRPKRDLVGYRYSFHPNCDLREVLSFTGTVYSRQMRFNLDLACKAFGVESSKQEGLDGRVVDVMFREGRYREIADYCLEDVRATADLYRKLAATILCWDASFTRSERTLDRRRPAEDLPAQEPKLPSEEGFIQSVTESSLELASSCMDEGEGATGAVIGEKQQASVLGKLLRDQRRDEEEDVQPLAGDDEPMARFDRS